MGSMQKCLLCNQESRLISAHLQVCGNCVQTRPAAARPLIQAAHARARREFDASPAVAQTEGGVTCPLCANRCGLGESELGYCGLRTVRDGRLHHLAGTPQQGILHWYRDPLPTNCVGMPVCHGQNRPGQHNLAVFYGGCTLNCLSCQNWHYRDLLPNRAELAAGKIDPKRGMSAVELAAAANPRTFCVCYFGGDAAAQMPHALAAARMLADQGVTICWETNGTANPKLMERAVALSLQSGGTVKFDLKAYDENLHVALTGIPNRQTLKNLARAAQRFEERPDPPPVIASTLLVPGYVDAGEVGRIADFIASFDPRIPYALLGFAPQFFMPDLPRTSVRHAQKAQAAAQAAGLLNVWVGNRHLLSRDY